MINSNFLPFPKLKTKRVVLRQLINGDENEIFKLRSDNNVNKYLQRSACKSIDDAKSFIKNILKNHSLYWAITLNNNNNLIGTICLFDFSEDNKKAEIGYELLPDFQGKGIMNEAMFKIIDYGFHNIGLNIIEAYTHPENLSSTKLLEKCNFKKVHNDSDDLIKYELAAKSLVSES